VWAEREAAGSGDDSLGGVIALLNFPVSPAG
jgi:hypothetical protein